jgi:murein DD-endopeptidase MepM/ murein hydrolase activator NlpD
VNERSAILIKDEMFKFVFLFCVIFLFTDLISAQEPIIQDLSNFSKIQKRIKPGDVSLVQVKINGDNEKYKLFCDNKEILSYLDQRGVRYAFVAESYFSERTNFKCYIPISSEKVVDIIDFMVQGKVFPSEQLQVGKRKVIPSLKDMKIITKEREFLDSIFLNSSNQPLFTLPFVLPSKKKITSNYGTKRIFNKSKQSQHLGTDFRAKLGEAIFASNSGKVIVARKLFYYGNAVVIDHGLGIFTIYGHLSKITVNENEEVLKSQLIGKAGSSGRATGPHLHWGVRIGGLYVDGLSLVEVSQQLDFNQRVSDVK